MAPECGGTPASVPQVPHTYINALAAGQKLVGGAGGPCVGRASGTACGIMQGNMEAWQLYGP